MRTLTKKWGVGLMVSTDNRMKITPMFRWQPAAWTIIYEHVLQINAQQTNEGSFREVWTLKEKHLK